MAVHDLNLVRVFVTLYETRSVTRCAQRLNVTQPSISYALSKLRNHFDDRLFVRRQQAMLPTITADQAYPDLKSALEVIEAHLDNHSEFNPADCNLRFRLALTDLGEMGFLPTILSYLRLRAPRLELEVIPLQIQEAPEWLVAEQVNAVICSRSIDLKGLERRTVMRDRYVCVGRQDLFQDGALTIEQFVEMPQAVVTTTSGHSLVEDILQRMNMSRTVALEVPHFSILPSILMETGLLSVIPIQIASQFAKGYELVLRPLPFEVPDFNVYLYWYGESNRSSAQKWFCQTILEAIQSMNMPEPGALMPRTG